MKLLQGKFRLDTGKRLLTEMGGSAIATGKVVMVPSLPEFQECLDNLFSQMVLF